MDALQAGLDGTPVVLIQGPPGTGKTRTILNLLSVVMHSAQKVYESAHGQAACTKDSHTYRKASSLYNTLLLGLLMVWDGLCGQQHQQQYETQQQVCSRRQRGLCMTHRGYARS